MTIWPFLARLVDGRPWEQGPSTDLGADQLSGGDDCTGGTYLTVQLAVNAASNGDVVIVHPNCANNPNPINIINRNNLQIVSADLPQGFRGPSPARRSGGLMRL